MLLLRPSARQLQCHDSHRCLTNCLQVVGKVMEVAQDQNGCRFLQKKFDEGGPASISLVFQVCVAVAYWVGSAGLASSSWWGWGSLGCAVHFVVSMQLGWLAACCALCLCGWWPRLAGSVP